MPRLARKAAIDAREALRFPTYFPAILAVDGKYRSIVVDDISDHGAHVIAPFAVAVGSGVTLIASAMRVRATVVRSTPRGYGLRLDEPIQPLRVVRANLAGPGQRG